MSKLLDFLTDLVTDTQKQRAFALTPDAVIDAAGLSEADKTMLKSGNRFQIDVHLTDELSEIALTVFEPNPDPLPDPDPLPPPPPPPNPDSPEKVAQAIYAVANLHQHP